MSFDERIGHCYELAAQNVIDYGGVLVHGAIQGKGLPPNPHAWVEKSDGIVYEPILDAIIMPLDWQSAWRPRVFTRYTRIEALIHILANQNYGPWDEPPEVEEMRDVMRAWNRAKAEHAQ